MDIEKWDEFTDLVRNGANGSKILVTTRDEAVASIMETIPPVFLKGLSEECCLSFLLRKAFGKGQLTDNQDLLEIVADIVKKCEGVPLIATVLGSSLQMETDVYSWKEIRDDNAWSS